MIVKVKAPTAAVAASVLEVVNLPLPLPPALFGVVAKKRMVQKHIAKLFCVLQPKVICCKIQCQFLYALYGYFL